MFWQYGKAWNGPKSLISLTCLRKNDFEKAYDRIEWNFIIAMLKALGFGPRFIHSVSMLFHDAFVVLSLNNSVTKAIGVFRSVRQGCPVAPCMFWLLKPLVTFLLSKRIGD